jgi:sugar-specific transcriptional regulator TrmB
MYIKVKNNEIIKFPYSSNDLIEENPSTNYTDILDLKAIFDTTEESVLRGYELYEVIADERNIPCNHASNKIVIDETPSLIDGKGVFAKTIVEKTQQEISEYNESLVNLADSIAPENDNQVWIEYKEALVNKTDTYECVPPEIYSTPT